MADQEVLSANGNGAQQKDWEYADEEAEDYEWEYETESEDEVVDKEVERRNSQGKPIEDEDEEEEGEEEKEDIPLEEQDLPDPFSAAPLESTTKKEKENGHGDKKRHKHKKHKKSRHLERIEAFNKKDSAGGDEPRKRIHVRSKDPSRIARQLEKSLKNGSSSKGHKSSKGRPAPPQQKVNTICKICGKEPYVVERIVAEKSWWHKNCFRCKQCNKTLNLDTYMSHEGVIYCKPHHRELFQPKAVLNPVDLIAASANADAATQEAIQRHREQERRMETIIRESKPVDLGDSVVKSTTVNEASKYAGLENLDVGSKFKMFERRSMAEPERPSQSSDRYGIMEKLKRLQEGEELDDLLAEIDEEMPDPEEDPEEIGLTEVQKRTARAERLFGEGGQERRDKMAEERRKELKHLREKLMAGTRDSVLDQFDDVLNASSHKIKKTKVDVRSENAKKFRDMFDKGEVPETGSHVVTDRITADKEQELENMRKSRRQQKDFFKKLEAGEWGENQEKKEPKLLVGKISKDVEEDLNEDMPEMASLSNRFSFFENYEAKEEERKKRGGGRLTPTREGELGGEEDVSDWKNHAASLMTEADLARKECKARSVLNKFKEMENRVLNGEDEVRPPDDPDKPIISALGFLGKLPGVGERRPGMKRFTPPRKLGSDESGSDYSGTDYSDSEDYTDSDSYTGSSYSDSDSDSGEDETLRAMRATARAKALRAKFEEWEQTKDAQDQIRQMELVDENGACMETATHLRAKFEALRMHEEQEEEQGARPKFRPRRFK